MSEANGGDPRGWYPCEEVGGEGNLGRASTSVFADGWCPDSCGLLSFPFLFDYFLGADHDLLPRLHDAIQSATGRVDMDPVLICDSYAPAGCPFARCHRRRQ